MARRIIGVIIFLYCGVAVIGAGREMMFDEGAKFGAGVGALIFCTCLSLIGLSMALGKPKPATPPDDQESQPPASE